MIQSLKWSGFFLLLSVCFWSGSTGWADDRAKDRATLRGIEAIVVKVLTYESGWSKELNKVGISENFLQAAIEGQLEKSGIPIVPEEASKESESKAFLIVRLAFKDPEPTQKKYQTVDGEQGEKIDLTKKYVYAIRLNLRQSVVLQRDADLKGLAITWQTEAVGFNRLTFLQDEVRRLVDGFIEAYFSENASKSKKE